VTDGTVTFKEANTVLALNMPLNGNGQASFSTSTLTAGTHMITALFSGTGSFLASSASLSQIVLTAAQAVDNLAAKVSAANIDPDIENSLLAKLNSAVDSFSSGNLQAGAVGGNRFFSSIRSLRVRRLISFSS
jgi:hypothetical protein